MKDFCLLIALSHGGRFLGFSDTDELHFSAESSGAFALCASMHESKPFETMIGCLVLGFIFANLRRNKYDYWL